MVGVYHGREQTKAKHFILKTYLQALVFKVLGGHHGWSALTYVDGFSGPWKTRTDDHSDSSFMIAIQVLKDAQTRIFEQTGVLKTVKCFFSESDPQSYRELEAAVSPHHDPSKRFFVETYQGEFETALNQIEKLIEESFALFFIDPTGWTGYSLETLQPHLQARGREVLINFMYDYINRFASSSDPKTVASLNPILGGEGWRDRLDPDLTPGMGVEKLFRETLRSAGGFKYVLSTRIDKATKDRPHFFLAYGTKALAGVKTFRDAEFSALKENDKDRTEAKKRKTDERENTRDLFAGEDVGQKETHDDLIEERLSLASKWAIEYLDELGGVAQFDDLCAELMQAFMLRETHVKDVCIRLHRAGGLSKTWMKQKPKSGIELRLVVEAK